MIKHKMRLTRGSGFENITPLLQSKKYIYEKRPKSKSNKMNDDLETSSAKISVQVNVKPPKKQKSKL